jgi:isopropylmalate/homocitrate/citramalate synthase
MLKDRRTYEIMRPEDVGAQTTLVSASIQAGTRSRSAAINWVCRCRATN